MEFKKIVEWLLSNEYLVLVGGKPVPTVRFEREIGYVAPAEVILTPRQISQELVQQGVVTSSEAIKKLTDPKLVWNAFIADSSIPHRVKSPDGLTYTIRQYGASVARKLMKIIQDPKVDYWRLVESTKHYYQVTTYKQLLSNYIDKDVWRHEYDSYSIKSKKDYSIGGGNPFEK